MCSKICLVVVAILMIMCCFWGYLQSQTSPPGPQPDIRDLLVDDDDVTEGWHIWDREGERVDGGARRSIMVCRDFSPDAYEPGISYQEVYYFASVAKAERAYSEWRRTLFPPASPDALAQPQTDWEVPDTIAFDSVADEYYYACNIDVIPQCEALIRYGNHIVGFYAHRRTEEHPSGMTDSQIEDMLEAIEAKAIQVLELSPSTPTP